MTFQVSCFSSCSFFHKEHQRHEEALQSYKKELSLVVHSCQNLFFCKSIRHLTTKNERSQNAFLAAQWFVSFVADCQKIKLYFCNNIGRYQIDAQKAGIPVFARTLGALMMQVQSHIQ